jgi:hypothetical protein
VEKINTNAMHGNDFQITRRQGLVLFCIPSQFWNSFVSEIGTTDLKSNTQGKMRISKSCVFLSHPTASNIKSEKNEISMKVDDET